MKKWKSYCAAALCAAMLAPCIYADAGVVVNRGSREEGSDSSEKEGSSLETIITETEEDKKEETSTTVKEDVIEPADIVFVIDSTGSMAPYIENVASNVTSFSRYLEAKKVNVRMAVVEYRDITCDGKNSTKIHTVDGTPWHKSTAELIKTLDIVKSGVSGGGDEPETLIDALGYVADKKSLKFSSAAHKFAIVLTDATCKSNNTHGLTLDSLIASLQEQDINPSVITDEFVFEPYQKLTAGGGMIANISSKNFSDELIKLADVIFKTIEKEVISESIKSVKSVKVTCKGSNTIKVGNSAKLTATILPKNADTKKVEWVVDRDGIVKLDISKDTHTCTVTGVKPGTASITAVSEDGGFTGDYAIKVIGKGGKDEESGDEADDGPASELTAGDIQVSPAKKTIAKGQSFSIQTKVQEDAVSGGVSSLSKEELREILDESIDSISYRSSNSAVASVYAKTGKVTAKRSGTAIIKTKVVMADGSSKTFKTVVYVK